MKLQPMIGRRVLSWTFLVLLGLVGLVGPATGAVAVAKSVRLALPQGVGDNMILQRPLQGDDHPVILFWSDATAIRVNFQGKWFEGTRSGERPTDRLPAWSVPMADLDTRAVGDLLISAIGDGKKRLTAQTRLTNVCMGDVWLWERGAHQHMLRLTNALPPLEQEKLEQRVRWMSSPLHHMDPRSAVGTGQWTRADLWLISPSAAFFALKWLEQPSLNHVGIVEIDGTGAANGPVLPRGWFLNNEASPAEVSALEAANRRAVAFKNEADRRHRSNINQSKYNGVWIDDSPLPEVERHRSIRKVVRSSRGFNLPFRGFIGTTFGSNIVSAVVR